MVCVRPSSRHPLTGMDLIAHPGGRATSGRCATQLGYSNAGHTFGDGLSDADRTAVIEYLKTL